MSNTGRTALIAVLVLITLPLLWGGMMMGGGMGPGMMWDWQTGDRWDWWRGMWMMVPGILVIVGLAAVLIWGSGGSGTSTTSPTAREILDARYARGEITREQYQEMKNELRS